MRRLALLSAAAAAALGAFNLTGALAGGEKPGKPSPPGQEQIPPGQAKKADDGPGKSAAPREENGPPGQAAKTEIERSTSPTKQDDHGRGNAQAKPAPATVPAHEKRVAPADSRSDAGKPKKTANPAKLSPSNGNSAVAHTHVIICHRTGSNSNPYVVINISMSAWLHGHTTHPSLNGHNDILLKQGAKPGEKMPRSACGAAGGTTTRTTPTKEATPPVRNTDTPSPLPAPQPGKPSAPPSPERGAGSHDRNDSAVAARVAEAAVASELPFTGLPVWVAMLAGLWLIASGLAIRKAFGRPSEEVSRSSDQFMW